MGEIDLLQLSKNVLVTSMVVSLPILLAVAVIGLAISLVQALTQVQEQSISFVPKMFAGIGIIMVSGSWMLSTLRDLAIDLLKQIGNTVV